MINNSREPNPDDDGSGHPPSSFQRTVILRDWWLVKCSKEFKGKRFGVAGTEIAAFESRAMRVFTSSPIIKALDVFTLQASDGVCITLRGFLDQKRVLESGFSPEIAREFVFGFPPCWEQICNKCFGGGYMGTVKACRRIISPRKNTEEDSPAESIDKSTVTEKNMEEISGKDGRGVGTRARDKSTPARRCSRLQAKSGGKEGVNKLESCKVQSRINDGDYGSQGLDKAKSSDVDKDEFEFCVDSEVILPGLGRKHTGANNVDKLTNSSSDWDSVDLKDLGKSNKPGKKEKSKERKKVVSSGSNAVEPMKQPETKVKTAENKRKLNASKVQKQTKEGDHGSEGVLNAKSSDVENDACRDVDKEVASVVVPNRVVDKTSKNVIKESLTSEQREGKLKVTKTSLQTLSKDLNNSSKPGKKGKSNKSEKTLESNRGVVEPMIHSVSKVKETEETMSLEKTKRKINFDLEVTPEKEPKKQETSADSAGSLGQKRSRSGRVLVKPLEFWRNQIPVYDTGKNLIQVDEGHESNSLPPKGQRSRSRKARK